MIYLKIGDSYSMFEKSSVCMYINKLKIIINNLKYLYP